MAEIYEVYREFQKIGALLYPTLNNTHSGNLSMRSGKDLIITKSGSMSPHLNLSSLVKIPIHGTSQQDKLASVELPLHRAVYEHTKWNAIVHTHPPTIIAMSLSNNLFMPIDEEGKYYNPEGIKIISALENIGSMEIAVKISEALKTSNGVILRGHGMFAAGETLEEAAKLISSSEHSADILYKHIVLSKAEQK